MPHICLSLSVPDLLDVYLFTHLVLTDVGTQKTGSDKHAVAPGPSYLRPSTVALLSDPHSQRRENNAQTQGEGTM